MDEIHAELAKRSVAGICDCVDRHALERAAEFVRHATLGGWIFPADALRSSTWEQRYYSGEDHDGEPHVWTVCPFCGHELPEPPASSIPGAE